jgi:hypothetical protein
MKPVRFSAHALRYRKRRGFTVAEAVEATRESPWKPAELGRLRCQEDFAFGRDWNGQVYETKRVRPIFVEDEVEITVVTV